MTSMLALAGCSRSSSSDPAGGNGVDNPGTTDGDDVDTPDGNDNGNLPDAGGDSLVIEDAFINGGSIADAGRTVWNCGNEGILSFWADGEGSRVFESAEQSFLWESQVAGTLTVNGEFSAAFFNFYFTDPVRDKPRRSGRGRIARTA